MSKQPKKTRRLASGQNDDQQSGQAKRRHESFTPWDREQLEIVANAIRAETGQEHVSLVEIRVFQQRLAAQRTPENLKRQSESSKARNRAKLSALVEDIRTHRLRLDLFVFMRVLLLDQVQAEIEAEEHSRLRMEKHAQQVSDLAQAMESMSQRKDISLPRSLKGLFDIPELDKAVRQHLADVERARVKSPITQPNWFHCAERMASLKKRGQLLAAEIPRRPWQPMVLVVIGNCASPGLDEAAIREWVVREKGYVEASPFGAEMARLNRDDRLLQTLIEEMKVKFPEESEAWFGAKPLPAAQNIQPGEDDLRGVYEALRAFVAGLKGMEREVMIALCRGGGNVPLKNLAFTYDWNPPEKGWDNLSRVLRAKLTQKKLAYTVRREKGQCILEASLKLISKN